MSRRRCCCTGEPGPALPGCDEFPPEDYQVLLCLNLVLTAPQCIDWTITPCSTTATCPCEDNPYTFDLTSFDSSFSCVINSGALLSKGWFGRSSDDLSNCYCCNDFVEFPIPTKYPVSVCYVTEANGGPGPPCSDEDYVYSSTNLYSATRFTNPVTLNQYLQLEFRLSVDVDVPAGSCEVMRGCPPQTDTIVLNAIQQTYQVARWVITYLKDTPAGTPADPDCCWCLAGVTVETGSLPGQSDRPIDCCDTGLEYPEDCCRNYTPAGACSCVLSATTNDCTTPMNTSAPAYIYCGSPPLTLRCTHVPC